LKKDKCNNRTVIKVDNRQNYNKVMLVELEF